MANGEVEGCPPCKLLLCGGTEVKGAAFRVIEAQRAVDNIVLLREIQKDKITQAEHDEGVDLYESIEDRLDRIYEEIEAYGEKLGHL